MVATIIRRPNTRLLRRDFRRGLIETSKTGISQSDVVNEAIDKIIADSTLSGTGSVTSSSVTPKLLKRRMDNMRQGKESQQ